ncbi:HAD family acid phosphatase [Streptomyces sp. NPDC001922]|uniref:HAD family acid phosphatase n=1 Tax=Streptomyces sp. NPDC001922 TaxID=3364624 RepID=UPI00367E5C69
MQGRRWRTRVSVTVAAAAVTTVVPFGTGAATAAPVPRGTAGTQAVSAVQQQSGRGPAWFAGVDYGTWQRDVNTVMNTARPYVEQRISRGSGEKMAIVLDIDNTSLETDFHPFWEYPTPAVRPVLDLARSAHARGVSIFFVTARPGIIAGITQHNLERVGYPVSGLHVRDLPDLFDEVSAYKTARRADIEAKGYTIIANIGNSPGDLVGGHAEKTFKLPDYDGKLS